MLFNSPIYILLFLPIVVAVYFALNHLRLIVAGKSWLVLASLFFYGYWNAAYLLLIISSILVNFAVGSALRNYSNRSEYNLRPRIQRKTILIAGIVFNLGLLGYYKYTDFIIFNFNQIFSAHIPLLDLLLPLAISFFTFQQIAYLVDSYVAETQEYNFLNYCLFVTFFPQLIAGPIVHHREMMPQFSSVRPKLLNWRNLSIGCFIFAIGLFKKVVIADTFAIWANAGFSAWWRLSFFEAWGTSLSYTFQLYYDFSGYTDMAIGAALMFNIHIPINFNSPYKAVNIQDFWQRWHMTLSRWLKDYIYIPLGGNRISIPRTYVNLFITFLLGGLWHGAGWTFIAWGALHGIALSLHKLWTESGYKMSTRWGWFCTFIFINLSWVVFRAEDLSSAKYIIKSMFKPGDLRFNFNFVDQFIYPLNAALHELLLPLSHENVVSEWGIITALLVFPLVVYPKNSIQIKNDMLNNSLWLNWPKFFLLSCITSFSLTMLFISSSEVFLYFNF